MASVTHGGIEMKAVFATIILSIFSAVVGVFSITELCTKTIAKGYSDDAIRTSRMNAKQAANPRQKIQQWVNH
jgi:hypothetical protein